MINMCQGHSSCELNADANFFNRPCPADHNAYLKVTYTCDPLISLLTTLSFQESCPVLPQLAIGCNWCRSTVIASIYDGIQGDISYAAAPSRPSRPAAAAPAPAPAPAAGQEEECNSTEVSVPMTTSQRHVIGFITEWITTYRYVSGMTDR
ncbi:hypothetical protein FJT64_016897 [Amphibalanus amphitrite]|uniref:SUEL-type lectin domain-containing protein n=1 Tax=Amphibalanus amphitrite TaxID=1232801 RepID=A0A6A4XCW9_AMPAM|nr:hypothetical protein FJT64_016897 [Amphibalanus amphitrite]